MFLHHPSATPLVGRTEAASIVALMQGSGGASQRNARGHAAELGIYYNGRSNLVLGPAIRYERLIENLGVRFQVVDLQIVFRYTW